MSHWLFSYCVYYTLCGKYGSDTHTIHRSFAGYFAYITKTVSRWILPPWYFHEFSLLVFIRWYFTEFNYWFLFHQLFETPTSQVTLKWLTWSLILTRRLSWISLAGDDVFQWPKAPKKKEFWCTVLNCPTRSMILTVLPSRNTVCDTTCTEPRRVMHATLSQPARLLSKNSILTKFISISLFR